MHIVQKMGCACLVSEALLALAAATSFISMGPVGLAPVAASMALRRSAARGGATINGRRRGVKDSAVCAKALSRHPKTHPPPHHTSHPPGQSGCPHSIPLARRLGGPRYRSASG